MSLHPVGMDIAEHIRTDPEAGTRRLMAEQGAALYAVALRLCGGDPTEADDLYVRTLERAVDRIAEQQGPHFFAWLSAICTNLHRQDHRRKALPLASDEELASIPDNGPTPLGELIARSDAEAVCIAVARLPERYREPVLLRYWAGRSHAEIAAALGIPEGTARQRLFQARALLRGELETPFERKTK